jgi:hypothetical protein
MKPLHLFILATGVALALALSACGRAQEPSPAAAGPDVRQAAGAVLAAFAARDGERLASLVHPGKGVRFSPYAFVDPQSDRVLSLIQVRTLWTDTQTYTWGFEDATGDPIQLTPAQYVERFVMDRDFGHPSSIEVNHDHARGNTVNNAATVYPNGTRVEYSIAPVVGTGAAQLDWAALRLVFEQVGGQWFLVAVIHDEWTT